MLKMAMKTDKGKLLMFGLSRVNCERLLAGQPIFFKGEDLGEPNLFFSIIGGETEEAMAAELEKVGGIKREGNADA